MRHARPRAQHAKSAKNATAAAGAPGRSLWILPLLWLAALAAYFPAWHGGLLWDDDRHLTRATLQTLGGLWRIWSDVSATQQYYPVTHSVFWLQHRFWGD